TGTGRNVVLAGFGTTVESCLDGGGEGGVAGKVGSGCRDGNTSNSDGVGIGNAGLVEQAASTSTGGAVRGRHGADIGSCSSGGQLSLDARNGRIGKADID